MEIEEAQAEGWDRLVTSMYWPPPVIELDGGLLMYPSKDPVGNGFGALFGRSSDGKRLMFGVPAAARETA